MPVLRGVESMNYADIEKGLVQLGEKVSVNKLFMPQSYLVYYNRGTGAFGLIFYSNLTFTCSLLVPIIPLYTRPFPFSIFCYYGNKYYRYHYL